MLARLFKLSQFLFGNGLEKEAKKIKSILKDLDLVRIFVYGSLRSGEENHYKLKNPQKEKNGSLSGFVKIKRLHGWAVVSGEGSVNGEVYLVPKDNLKPLDKHEAPQFKRKKITLDDGRKAWAWIFVG